MSQTVRRKNRMTAEKGSVDIRRLKKWARKNLSGDSKLRELILLDEDRMLPEAFLAKMDIWLALYDIESNQTGSAR